ncbi:Hypothetical_protein [Hexamita inflata]|uniref:Hypothetical_protein n=1 Tax=Hexamita inflata TaxID=28002 RepID=A0AA86NGB8_9EUKA|nr:Hypothetical protein HINF_LOCUS6433 [Hexamita inflata]
MSEMLCYSILKIRNNDELNDQRKLFKLQIRRDNMTQTRFLPLQINNQQMYNEYIGKQQQKGIVVDICQNQLSMEVQGEKDTFDKSYQPNDSQNLTQTVIHGADSLCSTRNLCRSSVEDFDADSGKTSSIICQDSFLNKAGYFPNGHHPVEQVRNTLQNPQSCQQEKLQLQTEQQQQESSEQCKKTVNIIYNNYFEQNNFAKVEQYQVQQCDYLVQQCENNNIRFEYPGTAEYPGTVEYAETVEYADQLECRDQLEYANQLEYRDQLEYASQLEYEESHPVQQYSPIQHIMLNQTQLEEHNTNIESKNQPEILITQAKAHLSKQPASQVISTQEAKPAPVKASKAEVTTANANKTAQDNLVDYKQLQAQTKVFENASRAQKQYFSLEMQLNHLKQLEASRKITKYRAFTCYLCTHVTYVNTNLLHYKISTIIFYNSTNLTQFINL